MSTNILYLIAYIVVGQYSLLPIEMAISLAPANLIRDINTFVNRVSGHAEYILATQMAQERSVPVSARIEVGRGGLVLPCNYGSIDATGDIEHQLWTASHQFIPQLSHEIVCTHEFITQADKDGA